MLLTLTTQHCVILPFTNVNGTLKKLRKTTNIFKNHKKVKGKWKNNRKSRQE